MNNHTLAHRATLTAAALLAGVVLASCGSDDSGEAANADHNDADVTFAADMIPHHAQAVEMAKLVDGKEIDPEVADLAADIEAAQAPEIETMTGWLEDWDEPVPDTGSMNGGHDMGDMEGSTDMPGMMSSEDMSALADAEGERFQTMWLEMMVEHHEGAVEMAQTEQNDGQYQPAIDLASTIEETQTEEITVMEGLLGSS